MRRRNWMLVTLLAAGGLSAVGCSGFDGPRQARKKPRPDLPEYSIEEQKRRAYDKYPALPQDDIRDGPRSFIDRPSPTGR